MKLGAQAPEADMDRMTALARALGDRAELIVDANQAWDETVAARCLAVLGELGVKLVEQPVPAWNIAAMARLRGSAGRRRCSPTKPCSTRTTCWPWRRPAPPTPSRSSS